MTCADLNGTLLLYTQRKSELTLQLNNICGRLRVASMDINDLTQDYHAKKQILNDRVYENPEYADTTEYQLLMEEVKEEYELNLAQLNQWETELEAEKDEIQIEISQIEGYESSFQSMLKNNIQKEFAYKQ